MYNKKLLKTITGDLDKAKAPAKKKDIAYDPSGKGMLNPNYAGEPVRLATDTLYNPTPYTIQAYADNGMSATLNPFDETSVEFPGAKYIDEYPSMKKGGSKKTSRSLLATNRLSKKNPLFKKKNYKGKTYDPQSMYFQDGGSTDDVIELELSPEEIQQYVDGGYVVQDISIPELPKAQLGKNTTLTMSPYSLNANAVPLASKVFGEYNPELLLGMEQKLPSRNANVKHNLSLDLGLPYTGTFAPSINAGYHAKFIGKGDGSSAFFPTVQWDNELGYHPKQGLNFSTMANPRAEFGNKEQAVYLKQNWPHGAWKGYAGILGGLGYRGRVFNQDVGTGDIGNEESKMAGRALTGYGANAGFEMRPFRNTPLRAGVDASLVMSPTKAGGEEGYAENPVGYTPTVKAKVVYPLGTNLKKYIKKADDQKKIDDDVFNRKEPLKPNNGTPDDGMPDNTIPDDGGGVPNKRIKRERKKREYEPINLFGEQPIGYLPGYDPDTGREVPESYTRNAYGFNQGPTMYKDGGYLPKAQQGVVIADPKQYAYRNKMYNDSLDLYNENAHWQPARNKALKDYINWTTSRGTVKKSDINKIIIDNKSKKIKLPTSTYKDALQNDPSLNAANQWNTVNKKIKPTNVGRTYAANKKGEVVTDKYGVPLVFEYPVYKKPVQRVYKPGEMPVDQSVLANSNTDEFTKLPLLPIRTFDIPVNERVVQSFPAQVKPEQANMAFRYRDQWQHAYDPASGKFKTYGAKQATLPYGEKLNEHPWEYNKSDELPESGHHVWQVGNKKYYNEAEAKAAAAQWDIDNSFTFEDGGFVVGDEVDAATMERLKQLGYTFEEI